MNEFSNEINGRARVYGDLRTFIYVTEDNSMKMIQNAALYVLALNCGIIVYWFAQYKPILNDFRTNHGAKNASGERNGQPRIQNWIFGKNVGLNRFVILVTFLSKIILPFVDSITGKSNRYTAVRQRLTNFLKFLEISKKFFAGQFNLVREFVVQSLLFKHVILKCNPNKNLLKNFPI